MGYSVDEMRRMRMVMAGVYTGLGVSSSYGFSIFTEHMKNKYGFTQGDITTISTVGNCCGYLVFFAGILYDYTGPRVVLFLAGLLALIGYLLFGLTFDGKISDKGRNGNVIQFCVYNAILYFGCPSMDLASIMPLMLNFPLDRGYMVIIQKTFSGLGTSILMAYYNGWFKNTSVVDGSNYSGYAYFLGVQIFVLGIIGAIFIDVPPYFPCQYVKSHLSPEHLAEHMATLKIYMNQPAPRPRLLYGCGLVIVVLIFVTTTSIVTAFLHVSKGASVAIAVICVILLGLFAVMALPLQFLGRYRPIARNHPRMPAIGVPVGDTEDDENNAAERCSNVEPLDNPVAPSAAKAPVQSGQPESSLVMQESDTSNGPVVTGEAAQQDNAESEEPQSSVGDPQYQGTFWRHLLTLDLWLLWLTCFGMWGTATVMIMNAAQIYRSKNYGEYSDSMQSLYVALMGVGSAVGRIFSGVVDMVISTRRREGKTELLTTIFVPAASSCLLLAYLFFIVVPAKGLILPFIVGSIGSGMGWGLGSLAVRIMYAEDIGKHYNFMYSSGFVSTIVLNRVMFGGLFDRKADQQGTSPYCNQPSCVRDQSIILLCVNVVAVLVATLAHIRFARFVRREKKKRAEAIAARRASAMQHAALQE